MAGEFRISIDLGHLVPEGSFLTAAEFPTLSAAVQRVAEAVHQQWSAYASGSPMPNGKVIQSRTGEYARSIQLRKLGDFSAEVYSDLAYALSIEEGSPERDLKRILSSSMKVRLTADGRRYLIIPFRWNHPNSVMGNQMPSDVWDWWHQPSIKASAIIGTSRRLSGTGAYDIATRRRSTVPGWKYQWGTRLSGGDLSSMGVNGSAARHMEGMVNFRKPGASGGAAQSQFINFRTMVEGSKGWIAPAQAGKWPAKTTADLLRPVAEEAFEKAVEEDIRRLLGGE